MDPHVRKAPTHRPSQSVPTLRLAVVALRAPHVAPPQPTLPRPPTRMPPTRAQQRGIFVRNQHRLARLRLRQTIAPQRAARAIARPRYIAAPPLRRPPGTQRPAPRTLHHPAPLVVAEQPQRNTALRGFLLRRYQRFHAPPLQRPVHLRVRIPRIRRHQRGLTPRQRAYRFQMGFQHLPLVHRPLRHRNVENNTPLIVHHRVVLVARLEPHPAALARKTSVGVRTAHRTAAALLPRLILRVVLPHHLVRVTLRQTLPTHVRPDQRRVHVNHFSLRHLRIQARPNRPPEYLLEPLLTPPLTDTRQARMIRQILVKPAPDEPPDRNVHLRLAKQTPVVYVAQQHTRQHQPHHHLRVQSRSSVIRAIALRHLRAKPTQIQYAVHALQDVILGDQPFQRTGHEQVHLPAPLAIQHRGNSHLGRVGVHPFDHISRGFSTAPCQGGIKRRYPLAG